MTHNISPDQRGNRFEIKLEVTQGDQEVDPRAVGMVALAAVEAFLQRSGGEVELRNKLLPPGFYRRDWNFDYSSREIVPDDTNLYHGRSDIVEDHLRYFFDALEVAIPNGVNKSHGFYEEVLQAVLNAQSYAEFKQAYYDFEDGLVRDKSDHKSLNYIEKSTKPEELDPLFALAKTMVQTYLERVTVSESE